MGSLELLEDLNGINELEKSKYLRQVLKKSICDKNYMNSLTKYLRETIENPHVNRRLNLCEIMSLLLKCISEEECQRTVPSLMNDSSAENLVELLGSLFLRSLNDHFSIQDVAIDAMSRLLQSFPRVLGTYYDSLLKGSGDACGIEEWTRNIRFGTMSLNLRVKFCHIMARLLENNLPHLKEECKKFLFAFPAILSSMCEEETHPCMLYFILGLVIAYFSAWKRALTDSHEEMENSVWRKRMSQLYNHINTYFPLSAYTLPKGMFYVDYDLLETRLIRVMVHRCDLNLGNALDLVLESLNSLHEEQRLSALRLLVKTIETHHKTLAVPLRQPSTTNFIMEQSASKLFRGLIKPLSVLEDVNSRLIPIGETQNYSKRELLLRCHALKCLFKVADAAVIMMWDSPDDEGQFYNSLAQMTINYRNWRTARMIRTMVALTFLHTRHNFDKFIYPQIEFFLQDCSSKQASSINRKLLRQIYSFLSVFKGGILEKRGALDPFIMRTITDCVRVVDRFVGAQSTFEQVADIDRIVRAVAFLAVAVQLPSSTTILLNNHHFTQYILYRFYPHCSKNFVPKFTESSYKLLFKKNSSPSSLTDSSLKIMPHIRGFSPYDICHVYSIKCGEVLEASLESIKFMTHFKGTAKEVELLQSLSHTFSIIYRRSNVECRQLTDLAVAQWLSPSHRHTCDNNYPTGDLKIFNEHNLTKCIATERMFHFAWTYLFAQSTYKGFQLMSQTDKCNLLQQWCAIAEFHAILKPYILQRAFCLLAYQFWPVKTTMVARNKQFIGQMINAVAPLSFKCYFVFAFLLLHFIHDTAESTIMTSYLVTLLDDCLAECAEKESALSVECQEAFQWVLSTQWINQIHTEISNNQRGFKLVCRIFIHWLSLTIIKIVEQRQLPPSNVFVGLIFLKCCINLPALPMIHSNLIEEYISASVEALLRRKSTSVTNINLLVVDVCKSCPDIVFLKEVSLIETIVQGCTSPEQSLHTKVSCVKLLIAIANSFAKHKKSPSNYSLLKVEKFLTKFTGDKKRIIRRAAAICKNIWSVVGVLALSRQL